MEVEKKYRPRFPTGFLSRATFTIVVGIIWLVFLATYLWPSAGEFGVSKSLGILILSLLVVCAVLIPVWIPWVLQGSQAEKKKIGKEK
jgi:hypothetical protein